MTSSQRIRPRGGRAAAIALAALACATTSDRRPSDPGAQAHFAQGEDLLAKGRFDEAARELEQAAALAPAWAPARLELGWARFHAGAFEPAEADFRAAVGLDPKEPRCRRGLGTALYVQGRYDEAAAELERWVDLAGGPVRAGDAAVFWALALRRDGGASAVRANQLLMLWTSSANEWVQFSGVTAESHVLTGPARQLGLYLLDDAEEAPVMAVKWGGETRRGFARYVIAANLLVKGKLAGARERLQKLAEPSPDGDDDLALLVVRALARADLKSLPEPRREPATAP